MGYITVECGGGWDKRRLFESPAERPRTQISQVSETRQERETTARWLPPLLVAVWDRAL